MSSPPSRRQDASHHQHRQPSEDRLPPHFCQSLNALLLASQPDLERIADVVAAEVAASQLILRAVNSTRTGLFHSVKSVRHAVNLLGAAGVHALLQTELRRVEPTNTRQDDQVESLVPTAKRKSERSRSASPEPREARQNRTT